MAERTAASGSPDALLDVIVVGAGFAGVYAVHKFRRLGFSVQAFEAGDDVGGTWYWNRYPGCRCDIESIYYSYQFDDDLQQEWEWTERYASQPEILSYIRHVADRFDLRRDIRFNTRVTAARFEAASGDAPSHWTITTDDGHTCKARFCVMASGVLSTPNLPDIPGRDTFAGKSYHTGRWPHEEVDFTGLKVAVIGTGSSGIQSIPLIAEQAGHVTVFQRTPNYAVPAGNRPLDPHELSEVKSRYGEIRAASWKGFTALPFKPAGRSALAVSDDERDQVYEDWWLNHGLAFQGAFADLLFDAEANRTAADFVRGKIRELVDDEEVAELLTPDFPLGCRRMCVDTDYYPTYNRENVTLVNISREPIDSIVPEGIRTGGTVHAVDAIVFATGYDAITGALLAIDLRGRDGLSLREKWMEGPRVYLGLATHGFPNLFMVNGPGSPSVLINMVTGVEQHVDWIADCMTHMRDRDLDAIEAMARHERLGGPQRRGGATLHSRRLRVLVHRRQHPGQTRRLHAVRGRLPRLREALRAGRRRGLRGLYADLTEAAAWRRQAAANLRTRTSSRSCWTCQRSYCNCCCNQLSGLPPKACDSRMAISGEIPSRPLSSMDSVLRDTARPLAAAVTVSPSGSRHWRRINAPGWGGLCMSIKAPS